MKNAVNLFCPMDKKMVTPHIEWRIEKCPGLCTIIFTSTLYLKLVLYHAVIYIVLDTLYFPFLCPNCAFNVCGCITSNLRLVIFIIEFIYLIQKGTLLASWYCLWAETSQNMIS